jgi:hypothetical protein
VAVRVKLRKCKGIGGTLRKDMKNGLSWDPQGQRRTREPRRSGATEEESGTLGETLRKFEVGSWRQSDGIASCRSCDR